MVAIWWTCRIDARVWLLYYEMPRYRFWYARPKQVRNWVDVTGIGPIPKPVLVYNGMFTVAVQHRYDLNGNLILKNFVTVCISTAANDEKLIKMAFHVKTPCTWVMFFTVLSLRVYGLVMTHYTDINCHCSVKWLITYSEVDADEAHAVTHICGSKLDQHWFR